jgi:sucrose-6-phosphatase
LFLGPRALHPSPPLSLFPSPNQKKKVDHADPAHTALKTFSSLWDAHFAADCLLVYSTGRSHALYEQLRREVPALRAPDALVCSVGTEIFFEAPDGSADSPPTPDEAWCAALDAGGWDRAKVEAAAAAASPHLRLQPASEQRPHKVSFHLSLPREDAPPILDRLKSELKTAGLPTTVIYSGGADVDVLPAGASKGKGLAFLLEQMREAVGGPPPDGVLVCGDSGNDVDLFEVPGVRGVVVANAHEELRAWAAAHRSAAVFEAGERCAGGIVAALRHFGLVPEDGGNKAA